MKFSTNKILPSLWLISLAPYVKGFFLAPGRREAKENRDFATGGGSFLPNFPDLYFFWAPLLAAFLLAADDFLGSFLVGGTLLFELSSKCCIPSNCSCWEEYEPENQMISTLKVRTIIEFQAKSLYRSRAEDHFYGTEYETWADYEQLLRAVFSCFQLRQTT